MNNQKNKAKMQWYRVDLHLHTPGSGDYQEPQVGFLDILRRAETRGLDIIAFTDHNTTKGYERMQAEIQQLELLTKLDRATVEEKRTLVEYRRLLDKILVLPGFEFTATFGFHILGIFSPETRVRQIEHILLSLNIPPQAMEEGNSIVGASADVISAYREINNAGGIVIAAHVNSAHGVAMRGFDFGGQTKIAYTQDPYLHALEVTDLERRGRGATSGFFNGSKPEYPRPMRCIQGSDAHRLQRDARSEKNLGIGDRVTEVLLPERSFEALRNLFQSNDFARSRPYRGPGKDFYDYVQVAREAGPNIVQAFHEGYDARNGQLYAIVADVCALANTNGGTVYVGTSGDIAVPVVGVEHIGDTVMQIRDAVTTQITPPLELEIDNLETSGKQVIRVQVPTGGQIPYAVDESKIYIRAESDTVLAVRDEIVRLVQGHAAPAEASIIAPEPSQVELAKPVLAANRPPARQDQRPRGERGPRRQQPAPDSNASNTANEVASIPAEASASAASLPLHDASTPNPVTPAANGAPAETTSQGRRRRRGGKGDSQPSADKASTGKSKSAAATIAPATEPLPSADVNVTPAQDGAEGETAIRRVREIKPFDPKSPVSAPRTGVEIVGTETRKGDQYHVVRDLRNGNIVKNVTKQSARRLWHYAILERENAPVIPTQVNWIGAIGLWKRYKRGDVVRYDLVMKEGNLTRVFYGVTEDGMHHHWQQFISDAEPEVVLPDEG